MRVRLRPLLVVVLSGLVAALVLAAVMVGGQTVRDQLVERSRVELDRELELIVERLQEPGAADPDSLVRVLAARIDHRVTLIDTSGTMLADSDVPPARTGLVENHGDRPEVRAAAGDTTAFAQRTSSTVGRPLIYAARRVAFGENIVVVRLAASLDAVEESVRAFRRRMIRIGLAALSGAVLLAWGMGGAIQRPLVAIARDFRAMTEGEREPPARRASVIAELDDLSVALSRLGEEFAGRLEELSAERDQMQILIDSMAEGVLALTDDARILRTNVAARELLELPSGLQFAPVGSVIRHPELRDLLESAVLRPFQSREVALAERHLIVQSRLVEGGGAVVTLLDVTELRRLEQVRRDFVANASHELKTPLTSVRGFAETLLEDDPPEEIRYRFLRSIRENTVRLQRLIDDLLDLSRLESGGWVAKPADLPVASTAWAVWEDLEGRAAEKDLAFEIRGDAAVRADPRGLSEIFQNLLENSVQYTPQGGSVWVEVRAVGDTVHLEVCDTGIGIPSASLPRVFERFYRADPARSREAGGTGLGLAIVRHLVEAMGGSVSAESRLGRGTAVRVVLPRARS